MKKTMLDYIHQTPAVLEKLLRDSETQTAALTDLLCSRPWRILRLVASGSSGNAAWCARPMLRRLLGMEVLVTPPHSFVHHENTPADDELVLVISQSGYSTNALAALELLREQGRLAVGLTGDPESDMKGICDLLVDYGCGPETVGYVTKGVCALILFLQLLGLEYACRTSRLSSHQASDLREHLSAAIGGMECCIARTPEFIDKHYLELSSLGVVYLCGSGSCYGGALEGALKLCETLQIPAIAYETEEYLHGPELQMTPNHTVFFLDDGGSASPRVRTLWESTRLVTRRCYLLSCGAGPLEEPDCLFLSHSGDSDASVLSFLPFFQILSYRMTEEKHLWHKHPLCAQLEGAVNGKSSNYVHKEVL